ncbi:hypothetical protein C2857_000576 [Epichloe festucae Fl1]|uniref:Uncharacterized protein n=1 Tax=Epichloe festucae (strain Fl1) TaxID=877507 RepID=A0A7S9KVD1_EPIFF|nr:hypothetical protein C2857_000576 [Epichloe festucae Fl1]
MNAIKHQAVTYNSPHVTELGQLVQDDTEHAFHSLDREAHDLLEVARPYPVTAATFALDHFDLDQFSGKKCNVIPDTDTQDASLEKSLTQKAPYPDVGTSQVIGGPPTNRLE